MSWLKVTRQEIPPIRAAGTNSVCLPGIRLGGLAPGGHGSASNHEAMASALSFTCVVNGSCAVALMRNPSDPAFPLRVRYRGIGT
jgi:hypothetical protein